MTEKNSIVLETLQNQIEIHNQMRNQLINRIKQLEVELEERKELKSRLTKELNQLYDAKNALLEIEKELKDDE